MWPVQVSVCDVMLWFNSKGEAGQTNEGTEYLERERRRFPDWTRA